MTKQKIIALLFGMVLSSVASTASAQVYTHPGRESGCLCYGPGINLEECRSVYGLGIPVQGRWPSTNNACGPEGGRDYGSRVLGMSILHCCIQHDLDWSTCEKPRWESDAALGDCVSNSCAPLFWQPVLFAGCKIAARAIQAAVTFTPEADLAYRASIENNCMCSPCGLPGRPAGDWGHDCYFVAGPDWIYRNGPLWDDGDCRGCRHNPFFPFSPWWPGFGWGSTLEEEYRDEEGPRFVQTDEKRWARFIEESYETDEERERFADLPSVEQLLAGRTKFVKAVIDNADRLIVIEAGTCAAPFWPVQDVQL